MDIKDLVRGGIVSSVNVENNTARVVFPDKDNLPSAELTILNRGSLKDKNFWVPDIGEPVLCLFLPNNETSSNQGFILGTHFSAKYPPPKATAEERILEFGDGTSIKYNRATHELNINCVGEIKINGKKIYLN